MQYPKQHKEIVRELLSGKFIVDDSPYFDSLHKNTQFYNQFFEETYGYYLEENGEFYYLSSMETTENGSRDVLLFLAVLCYEYHSRGKDIVYKMGEGTFSVEEVARYLEKSAHKDLLKKTQVMDSKIQELDIPSFLDQWEKRHLIQYTDKKRRTEFQFKKPINLFLDTAFNLYEDSLAQESAQKEA